MHIRWLAPTAFAVTLAALWFAPVRPVSLLAQDDAVRSQINANGSGMSSGPSESPFQRFVSQLKLDNKEQAPMASQFFVVAQKDAGPISQQLFGARQRMIAATLQSNPAELDAGQQAYLETSTRMTALELDTFRKVYALLRDNQKSRAGQAWNTMAGIFQPAPPPAARAERPQVESGPGGRYGGAGANTVLLHRLEILEQTFRVNKDEKKAIKQVLDDAFKSSAPVREGLTTARAAIVTDLQAGKAQPELDAAVKAYAEYAAAMNTLEVSAISKVLKSMADPKLEDPAAMPIAFFVSRGMFLDKSGWDKTPEYQGY